MESVWGDTCEQRCIAARAALALGLEGLERKKQALRPHNILRRGDLLPNPREGTPWEATYSARSNQAFILTTGFDVATFEYILDAFQDVWDSTPIPRDDVSDVGASRPERRSLSAAGGLALVLQYLNSTMPQHSLQQIFAITPSVCARYLRFGFDVLLRVLRLMPDARIIWPREERQFEDYASMITLKHPQLKKGFCFVDGLNLPVATSSDENVQNAYYNGWTCSHYCSCVFGFAPDGRIIFASLNAPGSWHDAVIARDLYTKLLDHTPRGYYAIADTAFPRNQERIKGKIKTPLKSNSKLPDQLREEGRYRELEALQNFNAALVSARQAAEWGMRAIQGSFARLKLPLPADDHRHRFVVLELCARLHQVRTTRVGINQIRNVYERIWRDHDDGALVYEKFATMLFRDIARNDRIARYYQL